MDCVVSISVFFHANELTYLHQQAIKVRFENAFPDYLFNDDFLFTSGFVNADGSSVRGLAYAE